MKAHGTAMSSYDMPSDHPVWETVRRWTKGAFTRRNMKVVAATAIGSILFGLMIWAFYQSIETLNTAEVPLSFSPYLF